MPYINFRDKFKPRSVIGAAASWSALVAAAALTCFLSLAAPAQQADPKAAPVVVQPGAPGHPSRTLPSTTKAMLPPRSAKDAEFMQGMIMHHAQAVEMTALMQSRTDNKELRLLGARISHSRTGSLSWRGR